ncbi:hypothetical protein ACFOOL_06845 [Devosia honganensis]|uniref:Uncharacterized protein n=1 Tax=Devosia honganensis TaxID=1610527 RepID=A0ABV7WYU0_9HYPH
MASNAPARHIQFLELMNDYRDAEVYGAPGMHIEVTPQMLDAGERAALSSALHPGDHPFSDHVIFRIYVAMERVRNGKSAG